MDLSIDMARNNRALREDRHGFPLSAAVEQMLLAGWVELIDRAHEEGSVRSDITGFDVPFLAVAVVAAALAADHDKRLRQRYADLIMEGLRPGARVELSGPPPSARDVTVAFSDD